MKTVAFHNLGCKVNAYELDVLQQNFVKNGYCVVPFDQKADIYIINTCTVTAIADRKSRQMLHRAKALNQEALVVAIGCYVETGREAIEQDENIDLAIGNHEKNKTVEIIEDYLNNRNGSADLHKITATKIGSICEYEDMKLDGGIIRTRADIKVEDGCNQFCSYCLIPYARGRVRSRKIEDATDEIKNLVAAGYSEFVLTGINLSAYGSDNGKTLKDLVTAIASVDGVKRLRMSSLEPRVMTEDFIKAISEIPAVCPHFHLSLQSGCNETLKRMNRHYTTDEFAKGVELLRKYFDRPALTTDIIAGFPGETKEEFERSYEFAKEMKFFEIHAFPYSVRKGTAAAKLPGRIMKEEKKERVARLLKLTEESRKEFAESINGMQEEVLIEADNIGHLRRYAEACVKSDKTCLQGDIVKGVISVDKDGNIELIP